MGVGFGILLLLVGLVLVLDVVTYDIPRIEDHQLGVLLVVVGAATIVLVLAVSAIRARRVDRVEHYERTP